MCNNSGTPAECRPKRIALALKEKKPKLSSSPIAYQSLQDLEIKSIPS